MEWVFKYQHVGITMKIYRCAYAHVNQQGFVFIYTELLSSSWVLGLQGEINFPLEGLVQTQHLSLVKGLFWELEWCYMLQEPHAMSLQGEWVEFIHREVMFVLIVIGRVTENPCLENLWSCWFWWPLWHPVKNLTWQLWGQLDLLLVSCSLQKILQIFPGWQ